MPLRRSFTSGLLLTALAVTAARACPQHSATTEAALQPLPHARALALVAWKPRTWQPVTTAVTAAQGMRVERDPVTGTLSMPEGPIATEAVRIGDDPAPILVERYANGMLIATLDDRFAEFAVVTLGADGKPHWTCVHGPAAAAQAVARPSTLVAEPAPGTVWEEK